MAVGAVVSAVVKKLADLLTQEAVFLSSVKGELEWIVEELRQIMCFLKEADAREGDENIKNWVNDLRDLAFDAEDVIEDYILKRKLRKEIGFIKRNAFVFNKMFILYKLGKDIEQIRNKISDISDRRTRYGIENVASEVGQSSKSASERLSLYRQVSHDLDEHDIVGFGEDLNVLTTRLIEQPLRRCVISIIAMGGSGPRKEVMGLKSEVSGKMNVEELKGIVREFLNGKKYLVVMDDVWTSDVWKDLKASLPDTNNGSRIVITTRIMEVAQQVDPVSLPHELKPLSDDDSWDLFTKKVIIAHDNTPNFEKCSFPMQLEKLGRKIVKTCGGLPLAIVLLGEGFIVKRGNEIVEDIGEEYLEELAVMNPKKVETFSRNSDAFGMLRVLDLSYLSYFKLDEGLRPILPKSLGKLVHLRYLRLSNLDVSNLPTIIRNLWNLQILDLKFLSATINDKVKPDSLSNLHQLRQLRLCGFAFNPPSDEGSTSRNFQTLNQLGITKWSRVKDGCDNCTNLKQLGFVGDLHLLEEDISNWISNLD
ncbi:hypothetical protein GIB67_007781 [Kingdonia uniflora]|uniref:Uncharacterized protein n=1 Tax=Kingdonia uniflora TaxID=39325 RepID=A0A7J7N279_9MAGN|nr:hypothetical protein GIB67_007781 [Kingdonia uniflora]